MKKLILNNTHEHLGAKMIDFGGFYMPVQYEGVKAEHHAEKLVYLMCHIWVRFLLMVKNL